MAPSRTASLVVAIGLAIAGCSSTSGSSPPPPPPPGPPSPPLVPPPGPAYAGPANLGPCASDADCRTVDNCGCACNPLLQRVRIGPSACEETCPGDGCAGKVARCNATTHQCEVAPGVAAPNNIAAPS